MLISIKRFFLLRAGVVTPASSGDFIDNQSSDLVFAVALSDSEEHPLIIYNQTAGVRVFGSDSFRDAIGSVVGGLGEEVVDSEVLAGLLKSTFEQDSDGLADVSAGFEARFFRASEVDAVGGYAPCFFGIGSVVDDVEHAYFDTSTHQVVHDRAQLGCLTDLYGRIDEDETWVVGVRGG